MTYLIMNLIWKYRIIEYFVSSSYRKAKDAYLLQMIRYALPESILLFSESCNLNEQERNRIKKEWGI